MKAPAAAKQPAPKPAAKAGSAKGAKPATRTEAANAAVEALPALQMVLTDEPSRILSLQFVRDGDEFLARLETAGGHITELKNRSLDQLLTMVAGELEDLLG